MCADPSSTTRRYPNAVSLAQNSSWLNRVFPKPVLNTRGLGKEEELTADQVKDLVEQNPDLGAPERAKVLRNLTVIVLAQNRRVDVVLSTTGQQSVRLYPFNAADSLTLIDERNLTTRKKAAAAAK